MRYLTASPLHGGADRNYVGLHQPSDASRSPLHGGADRNMKTDGALASTEGRPFTGARIETSARRCGGASRRVVPSRGRGSKHPRRALHRHARRSPLHGGADRNAALAMATTLAAGRPFTGARIETPNHGGRREDGRVAPSRGRGSKQARPRRSGRCGRSPLHGGADRNTAELGNVTCAVVAPSRGRGSKLPRRSV